MPKQRVVRHAVTQPSDPSYRLIPLTQGQNAIVDTADYEWLNQWNWHALWFKHTKSFYAVRSTNINGKRTLILMSREIISCGPDEEVDHWNHDTLDNRKKNLRKATTIENARNHQRQSNNKSGAIGVSWYPRYQKWRAVMYDDKKQILIGYFKSKEEAIYARDMAVKKLYGEFAVLNL